MLKEHQFYFSNKDFLFLLFTSSMLFAISLVINWYAGLYATEEASNSVTDIILSNIRPHDVDELFINGTILFWLFVALLCVRSPKVIPFTLASMALFIVIRSIFISLTHIGPFPTQIVVDSDIMSKFAFSGDLFFSGHTGLPFLMALIFWKNIYLRILFILSAVAFGIIVLMAHLHYSIDVLSAFFITYSIYHISELFFSKEHKIFHSGLITLDREL